MLIDALKGKETDALVSIMTERLSARIILYKAYLDARNEAMRSTFTMQKDDKLARLDAYFGASRKLDQLLIDATNLKERFAKGGLSSASAVGEGIAMIMQEIQAYNTNATPVTLSLDLSKIPETADNRGERVADLNVLISTLETRRAEVDKAIRDLSAELVSSKGYRLYQDNLGADFLTAEADRLHRGLIKLEGINTNVFEYPTEGALGAVIEKRTFELSDLNAQLATETFIQDTLSDQRNIARTNYNTLATKLQESRVSSAVGGDVQAKVIFPAIAPSSPYSPVLQTNVTIAIVAGFLVSVLGVLVFEYLRRELGTASSVAAPRDLVAELE